MTAVAVDAAGNSDQDRPQTTFTVGDPGDGPVDDVEDADSSIVSPGEGDVEAGPGVEIVGVASDNVGVTAVRIGLQDRDSKLWLQDDGSFGSFTFIGTAVDAPGATSTGWSLAVDLEPGTYRVTAVAVDAAGNSDQDRPQTTFTVS